MGITTSFWATLSLSIQIVSNNVCKLPLKCHKLSIFPTIFFFFNFPIYSQACNNETNYVLLFKHNYDNIFLLLFMYCQFRLLK